MTDKELMQMTLDALEKISMGGHPDWADDVIPLLRARLAQPEPELWASVDFDIKTAPPQREWQKLTDDEIKQLEIMEDEEEERKGWCDPKLLIAWTEAKLKEKNT